MGVIDRRILVLALARFADTIGNGILVVLIPAYLTSGFVSLSFNIFEFGFTEATLVGVSVSTYALVSAGTQRYAGRLSDWFAYRKGFVALGLALIGGADFLYPFVGGFPGIVLLRAVQGLGAALSLPASMAIVNEFTKAGDRGGDIGLFNAVRLSGYVVGPLVAGGILSGGPYAVPLSDGAISVSRFALAFVVAGSVVAVSILLVALFVPEPDEQMSRERSSLSLRVFGNQQLFHPIFALGATTFLLSVTVDLFVPIQRLVNQRLGQSQAMFSAEYAALMIAVIVLLIPAGKASDRFGRRVFILAGAAALTPAVFVQAYITSPVLMVAARFLQGGALAIAFSPSLAFAGDLANAGESGSWLAIITTTYGLGRACGPLVGGVLGDISYQLPFFVGSVLALVALGLVVTQVKKPANSADTV
ncbi:MFS transporter [Haloferax sp. Atlit-12N]|uniref:MFS transporter n=1 Tax=Haloferax sp. Atlit-12N TaxID=2077203 RepID=UPI000E28249D|nr:MFS transporter [Haloferax sp. Atlit-12N]RDZ65701.1 MFS transporter [Haloferax sp. Atlit-12N]